MVGSIPAKAQVLSAGPTQVDVPFSFTVQGTSLPSGLYTVKRFQDTDTRTLQMRSADGRTVVFETRSTRTNHIPLFSRHEATRTNHIPRVERIVKKLLQAISPEVELATERIYEILEKNIGGLTNNQHASDSGRRSVVVASLRAAIRIDGSVHDVLDLLVALDSRFR